MNTNSINSNVINATVLVWDLLLDNISFNNYWLQNNNIITEWEWLWIRDYPNRRINIIDIPQGDWQILNDTFYSWRTVILSWILNSTDSNSLNDLIDEFKLNLSFANKLLKWKVNWETRQINATISDIRFWTKERIFIPFDITFISQNSYWTKTNQESVLIENMSDNSRTEDITNILKEAFPLFIFWVKTWSITALSITSNSIWITVNETITSWDVLYIDGRKKQVLLNGSEIDFEGVFPLLNNWSNNVEFTVTWTYTSDVSVIYENNLM